MDKTIFGFWNEYQKSDYLKQKEIISRLDISLFVKSVMKELNCSEDVAKNIVTSNLQSYFNDIFMFMINRNKR